MNTAARTAGPLFETDDELGRRLRAVEAKLLGLELASLAAEVAAVARILDPHPDLSGR